MDTCQRSEICNQAKAGHHCRCLASVSGDTFCHGNTSLLRMAPLVMVILNLDGSIQFINPYFEQLSGYTLAEVQGKDWFSIFIPERDKRHIRHKFQQAVQADPTRGYANPILTRDGRERIIEWNDQIIKGVEAQPDLMLAVGVDVTEREQQAAQLRQSEMRLNEAQHIARVGSWELDLRTDTLFWTDEIFELFGLCPHQFVPSYTAFLDAIHPDDCAMVNAAYTASLRQRTPYVITYRLALRSGRVRWVEERCDTVFADDGTPLISRGTIQDITDRHAMEQQLRQWNETLEQHVAERTAALSRQNERNRALLRATPDGFVAVNVGGRIQDVNPAFAALLDCSEAELRGMNFIDLDVSDGPATMADRIRSIISQGHVRFETRLRKKSGALVNVEITTTLVELDGESMVYGFARDITERKQAEQTILTARDEAQRANTAKSEFLSRMSHELRTPLNAILGFGQLLQLENNIPETQQQHVREIMQAGQHLLQLVNDILDLARVESGKLALERKELSVLELVDACVAQVKPAADLNGIEIRVQRPFYASVWGDELRLKQVLFNLLSNAIKYNQDNGQISIHFTSLPDVVRITVTDTGIGIPQDQLPRLFQPFERLVSAYQAIEGTGIGLALAKQLVEAMNGRIGVSSILHNGSSFWIELPCCQPQPMSLPAERLSVPVPATTADARFVVLYIEDNPANLRLVRKLVEKRSDIDFISASNGESGLELMQQLQPNLILLDINLPGMDGYAVFEKMSRDNLTRHIPVVAVSANAMPKDVALAKASGFSDYLTKPINIAEFFMLLDRYQQAHRGPCQ